MTNWLLQPVAQMLNAEDVTYVFVDGSPSRFCRTRAKYRREPVRLHDGDVIVDKLELMLSCCSQRLNLSVHLV